MQCNLLRFNLLSKNSLYMNIPYSVNISIKLSEEIQNFGIYPETFAKMCIFLF